MEDCEILEDLVYCTITYYGRLRDTGRPCLLYDQHCYCQLIYYLARLSDCQTITGNDSRDDFALQIIKEYDEVCKDIRQPYRSE